MNLTFEFFGRIMNFNFLIPSVVLMLIGLGQYFYRKKIEPISQSTIDELSDKSFLGSEGLHYSPRGGQILFIFGLLIFVIFFIVNYIAAPTVADVQMMQDVRKAIQNTR